MSKKPPPAPSPKNLGKRRRRRRRHQPKKINKKLLNQFVDKHLSVYKEKMDDLKKLKKKYYHQVMNFDFDNAEMRSLFSYIVSFIMDSSTYINLLLTSRKFYEFLSKPNKKMGHYSHACHYSENVDFYLCSKPRKKSKYVRRLFIIKDFIIFKKFRFLKVFPNLQHLEIKHQFYFNGEGLKYVKNLTSLSVKVCDKFSGEPMSENTNLLSNLRSLEISENDIVTDSFFSQFSSLESLKISKCKNITKEAIENLTRLRKLKITHCNKIENETFSRLRNVNKLMLKWCNNISGQVIGTNLLHLTDLTLWNLDKMTDDIFTSHPHFNTNLRKLGIKFCRLIEGKNIINNFSKLKELRLMNNEKLCDDLLFKCYENLEYLEIRKCKELTDKPFLHTSFSKLVVLKIWGLSKVTDQMFKYLNNLQFLEIEYCRGIGTSQKNKKMKKKKKNKGRTISVIPEEILDQLDLCTSDDDDDDEDNYYKQLTNLKSLTLKEGFSSNTIRFFSNLSDNLLFGPWFSQNLRVLKLGCTKKITGDGFGHLENLEKLQIIDLDEVDDEKIGKLTKLRDLEIKRCKKINFKSPNNNNNEKKNKKKKKNKIEMMTSSYSSVFDLEDLMSVKIKTCPNVEKGDLRKLKRKLKKNKKEMKKKKRKRIQKSNNDNNNNIDKNSEEGVGKEEKREEEDNDNDEKNKKKKSRKKKKRKKKKSRKKKKKKQEEEEEEEEEST